MKFHRGISCLRSPHEHFIHHFFFLDLLYTFEDIFSSGFICKSKLKKFSETLQVVNLTIYTLKESLNIP